MIAALFLACAADVKATLRAEPARATVGEPVQCILEALHPASVTIRLPEKLFGDDGSWIVLDEPRIVRTPGEPTLTRATWRAFSLEAGERKLPLLSLEYDEAGAKQHVEAEAGTLTVNGALAPDEDEPRPMKGFRPTDGAAFATRWPWIAGSALLAIAAGLCLRRMLRKKPAPAAAPTPIERVAALEKGIDGDPEASRRVVYDVSRILREAVDAYARTRRASLTDAAWIARVEPDLRLPAGVRSATARLLREAEQVKYAQVVPTRFKLAEILADARNALEALGAAPPLPAEPANSMEEAA